MSSRTTSLPLLFGLVLMLGTFGCGGDNNASEGSGSTGTTAENCATSIADSAPAFYKKYFKCVTITTNGDNVTITSKGLPPHQSFYYNSSHANYVEFTGTAPYYKNPNEIGEQNISITVAANPTAKGLTIDALLVDGAVGSSDKEYGMGPVGVAIDSVALFNPLAAPGDDITDEVYSFDAYNGHPAGSTYHYHTTSPGPLEILKSIGLTTSTTPESGTVELYGMMCDGSLVLGCTELDGTAADNSDFDSQNGHVHDIKDADTTHFTNRYHTHICPTKFGGHKFTPEIQYYNGCN